MNNGDDLDDDDIPASAFTGEAPAPATKPEPGLGKSRPSGPLCPACGDGVHTWENKTKNQHHYFRCSTCRGCWWPMRDKPSKIDPSSKWPPLDKKS